MEIKDDEFERPAIRKRAALKSSLCNAAS